MQQIQFTVKDMTCHHCVQTITQAVQALSPQASVQTDLGTHRVTIRSSVDPAALQAAIADEGYDVQPA